MDDQLPHGALSVPRVWPNLWVHVFRSTLTLTPLPPNVQTARLDKETHEAVSCISCYFTCQVLGWAVGERGRRSLHVAPPPFACSIHTRTHPSQRAGWPDVPGVHRLPHVPVSQHRGEWDASALGRHGVAHSMTGLGPTSVPRIRARCGTRPASAAGAHASAIDAHVVCTSAQDGMAPEVESWLKRKFDRDISGIEHVQREDPSLVRGGGAQRDASMGGEGRKWGHGPHVRRDVWPAPANVRVCGGEGVGPPRRAGEGGRGGLRSAHGAGDAAGARSPLSVWVPPACRRTISRDGAETSSS